MCFSSCRLHAEVLDWQHWLLLQVRWTIVGVRNTFSFLQSVANLPEEVLAKLRNK